MLVPKQQNGCWTRAANLMGWHQINREQSIYLHLDSLSDKIVAWFKNASQGWTANTVAMTQAWIDKDLHPRVITRDLQWGVPIPHIKELSYEKNKVFLLLIWCNSGLYEHYQNLHGRRWSWSAQLGAMVEESQGSEIVPISW